MNFHPYSIDHAPRALPIWQTILDDLGNPHPSRIAKVLGLGVRTVYRYNREAQAPRHVCLALFWLTRWGRSQVDCQAVNDCQLAVAYANAIETELHQARTQLAHVLALSDTGAANQPVIGAPHARTP
jgi:predicted DNA-binding transcriptional regulator AlpA